MTTPQIPLRPRDDRDVELGLLLWLALVVSGFIFGLFFYIASEWFSPARSECSEAIAGSCNEGICVDGKCQISEPFCELGASCGGCLCSSPRTCDEHDLCVMPTVPPSTPVCANAEAMTVLDDLIKKQRECDQRMARCQTQRLGEYMTDRKNFDEVLTRYGEVFVLIFPDSKPAYGANGTLVGDWPDSKTRAHYLELLRARRSELWEAGYIIALGRASQTRSRQRDAEWAQARVIFFEDLLTALADESGGAPSQAELLEFAVGSDASLSLETLEALPQIRVIGPSNEIENEIYAARDALKTGGTPRNVDKLNAWLNRSVVVVTAPKCPGRSGS